ncbi:MAG: polymer-forming cytoskeletal protein [candidate division WOR-3 bacterium]|nr:MAG: polymer-forming cytoskeletal protein [candidate division WOR-3 bacterium]
MNRTGHGCAAAGILLLAAVFLPADAARLETGDSFRLPAEEVQAGDLYYGGNALHVDGIVEGSVVAGGQTVTVAGTVTRNLFFGAQTVDVTGTVQGDIVGGCMSFFATGPVWGAVRVAAGSVTIGSRVEQDVLAGCRTLSVRREAEVRGDVIAGCGTMEIDGTVRGDIRAGAEEIIVSGTVDGDMVVTVGEKLVLTEDARVFGSVRYWAEKELDLGNPDAVFGDISFTKLEERGELAELRDLRPRLNLFTMFLLPFAIFSVLGALAVGFILVALWKHALTRALDSAAGRFGRTVGFGALGLFAVPVAILVSFVLIVTIPAGLIMTLLYLIALYLGKILAGMFLGRWLFRILGGSTASVLPDRGPSMWLTAPVGIVLAYALCAIPFVGWAIWLFGLMVGFGVMLELLAISRRQ